MSNLLSLATLSYYNANIHGEDSFYFSLFIADLKKKS